MEKKHIYFVIGCILVVIIGGLFCYRYYVHTGQHYGNDAIQSVQQIERNNERAIDANNEARRDNQAAQTELNRGQADLDGASNAAGRLQDSLNHRTGLIDEAESAIDRSQQLTTEQRSIFEDIDRANQGHGADNQ